MNKNTKFTVFVEGLAEQIFVRQLIYAWFGYDQNQIGFECLALHKGKYANAPYDVGDINTSHYFYRIINTGNDNKVVQQVLSLSSNLVSKGFAVLGLRDMYSQNYLENAKKRQCIEVHQDLNEKFITSVNFHLDSYLPSHVRSHTHVCFAIMEVETWILAMKGYEHDEFDKIFHPAETLKKEVEGYDKHGNQIESLVSTWEKDDFLNLYHSGKCQSFNDFLRLLIPLESWV